MLQNIPDPTPFLKYGIVGALLFVIICSMVLAGVVGIKVVTVLVHRSNGKPLIKPDSTGAKPVEFWELTLARIFREGITPLVELLVRVERNQVEMLRLLRNVRAHQKRELDDEDQ